MVGPDLHKYDDVSGDIIITTSQTNLFDFVHSLKGC
jgi:hypothetical protein